MGLRWDEEEDLLDPETGSNGFNGFTTEIRMEFKIWISERKQKGVGKETCA